MSYRLRRTALSLALLFTALAAAPAAHAFPVTVNLRVEGPTKTVFDGPVTTDAHDVTTQTAGTHKCDGTNGAAEPEPGPTATGALDDAAKLAGFTIDGPYGNFGIDDYFLERVGDEQIDPNSEYWSLWINHGFSDKGGCQKRVLAGQDVLWAGIPFSVSIPLKLTGPDSAVTGQPVQVKVTDGSNGNPQGGATVGGATTGADGQATLTFPNEGIYRLKAEKPDTVRSNTVVLCVDPPGAAPCTSSDNTPPVIESGFGASDRDLPGRRLASRDGRSRTMLVSWGAQDGAGSGVAHYTRRGERGGRRRGREPGRARVEDAARQGSKQRAALPRRVGRRLPLPDHGHRPRPELGEHRDRPRAGPRGRPRPRRPAPLAGLEAHAGGECVGPHGRAREPGRRNGAHALPRNARGADRTQTRQGREAARDGRRQEPDAARARPHRVPQRPLGEPEAEARLAHAAAPLTRSGPGGARRGGAVAMRARGVILGGLAVMALAAPPAAGAAAPKVQQLVVFRSGQALQKMTGTGTATVRVRGRRCAAGGGTALAALVRSQTGAAPAARLRRMLDEPA